MNRIGVDERSGVIYGHVVLEKNGVDNLNRLCQIKKYYIEPKGEEYPAENK